MFENIGGKIKTLAGTITIIGMLVSVIIGLLLMMSEVISGLVVGGLGCLFSWIGSFVLYGLGEVIEQLQESNRRAEKTYLLLKKLTENSDNTHDKKEYENQTVNLIKNEIPESMEYDVCPVCGANQPTPDRKTCWKCQIVLKD